MNNAPLPRFVRPWAGAAVVAALVLAGCGPAPLGDGPSAAPSASQQALDPDLECVQQDYPCSMAAVPQVVAERTIELGDDASERMSDGEPAEDVGASLKETEGVAEVTAQGDTLRYRLDGGRPAWVAAAPAETGAEPEARIDATLAMAYSVAGNDDPQKRAIVLSPFKWELGSGDYGSRVADLLRATKGYASGVSYLENATETATNVTVDTFGQLAGNAVVYIQTNSLKICEDGSEAAPGTPTPPTSPCWGIIGAQEFYDVETGFREADHVGVELFKYVGGSWSLGLSADFFNAQYAAGIDDAIIVLNAPDVLDSSLIESIQGASSEFLGWDNLRPMEAGGEVILSFLRRLADTGRTADSVYDEMRADLRAGEAALFHILASDGGSQRIREVVALRDRSSGEPLDEVGEVSVSTKLGDDEPDLVPYMVDVEGLSAEEAAKTTINLFYGNYQMDPLLAADGEQIDETTWRVEGLAQIGALTEGQSLEVLAYVQLPEGGLSRDPATVTVTGMKRPEIGTKWAGTITSTLGSWFPGVTITRTAEVEFTRDPGAAADADQVYFYVSGGHMTWSMSGTSEGCSYSGEATSVPLDADEYTYLLFDVSGESITYSANANNDDGPSVDVQVSCDTHDYTYGTGAEGLWWYLPPNANVQLTGDTMTGEWSDGSEYPTTWKWDLHRVED